MTAARTLVHADFPDPDVIRVDDTYYMLCATKHFYPGGEILKSKDMVNWEIEGYVYDSLEGTMEEHLWGELTRYGKGMEGGSICYHNGLFYVSFCNREDHFTYIFSSKSTKGPWNKIKIPEEYYSNSLFFDDDGRAFMVFGYRSIYLQELKEDLSGPKEDGIKKVLVEDKDDGYVFYCGTHFQKINGRYYLLIMKWPKEAPGLRTQYCFSSDRIDGEYTGGKMICDDFGVTRQGVAQGCLVNTPEGEWYAVMLQDRGAVGRMPVAVPMSFKNNMPVVDAPKKNKNAKSSSISAAENSEGCEPIFCSDDFKFIVDEDNNYKLKKQWQWNHQPDNRYWWLVKEGGLHIRTGKVSTNLIHAQNTLTQRCVYPGSTAQVTIDGALLNDGDYAGLCILQGCYGFIGLTKELNQYYLVVISRELKDSPMGDVLPDYLPGTLQEKIPVKDNKVTVRITTDFEEMEDSAVFEYVEKGKNIAVGKKHNLYFKLDHFTGARYGLCIYSTRESGGAAGFNEFRYIIK